MAYNNYVNPVLVSGKLDSAARVSGVPLITAVVSWVVGASDYASTTPIYRVFKDIPSDAIILSLEVMNEAVAGVTSGPIGLYSSLSFDGGGAIIGSGNQLNTGFAFSSANAIASGWANALATGPAIASRAKQLWEIAAQTQAPGAAGPKAASYDICFTMTSMTTNTANIVAKLTYVRGV